MRKIRRRRCLCCQELFRRDPRTHTQQKYCSKPQCKAASKRASQQRWLNKPENHGYFCGPQRVSRVQAWRAAHPDYWQAVVKKKKRPLQETKKRQPIEGLEKKAGLPLQETSFEQGIDLPDQNGTLPTTALQDVM